MKDSVLVLLMTAKKAWQAGGALLGGGGGGGGAVGGATVTVGMGEVVQFVLSNIIVCRGTILTRP